MEIYSSPAASINFNYEHQCVLQTINDFMSTEELKNFQKTLIEYCKLKKPKRIITDAKELKVVKPEDMEWMKEEVLFSLSRCGVEHFAIVMPENPFGQMAVQMFVEASKDINMKVFKDLNSAKEWIHSCISSYQEKNT